MTTRDRIVLIAVIVGVVLVGGWLFVVSPERKQAAAVQAQVTTARTELETATTEAAGARAAERRYAAAYRSVVALGKAVPPTSEVPSLIVELEAAAGGSRVDFSSIAASAAGSTSAASSSAASAASAASPAAAVFTPMPFTFVFKGTYTTLARLLGRIEGFVAAKPSGGIVAAGRLLTIQGAAIAIENSSSKPVGPGAAPALTATVTATAYVLPASVGLTGGATPAAPGAASSPSSSPGSSAAPAVVKATP
jgi:trimeric autotransporter adhesin